MHGCYSGTLIRLQAEFDNMIKNLGYYYTQYDWSATDGDTESTSAAAAISSH